MIDRAKTLIKHTLPPTTSMVDRRLEALDHRFEQIDNHIGLIDQRMDEMSRQLQTLLEQNKRLQDILEQNQRLSAALENNEKLLEKSTERLSDELSSCRSNTEKLEQLVTTLRGDVLTDRMARGGEAPACDTPKLIVSIASYGPRINYIEPMIESLRKQTVHPDAAILWLPSRDFPHGLKDLSSTVVCALYDAHVTVRFVDKDLGPHNKYFWVMQEYPESTVVTLDDDIIYPPNLLERLTAAHEAWPDSVIGMRTHLIATEDGEPAPYKDWVKEQDEIRDLPSQRIIATGSGGVLYPAGCLDARAFDPEGIVKTCLRADDLWLKVMEAAKGTKTVCPSGGYGLHYAAGTQEVALYHDNIDKAGNDAQLRSIIEYLSPLMPNVSFVKLVDDEGDEGNKSDEGDEEESAS